MSFEVERSYKVNGISNYRLRNIEDIVNIYRFDAQTVKGYDSLDDLNKALYKKFLVNFLNGLGLDSRATLIPKGIYFVEDITYKVKENPDDECFTEAGHLVKTIDRNGKKKILHKWIHEDYKHLEIIEGKPQRYLRIEYKHQGRSGWLHIINETQWY